MILSTDSDGVNCTIHSSSANTTNLNVDIIPYISDDIPKEKFAYYIKLKNENKYLSSDGKNIKIVTEIANAHLWRMMTKNNIIPEIIINKKELFKNAVIDTYDIRKLLYPSTSISPSQWEFTVDGPEIYGEKIYIKPTYKLSNSFMYVNGNLTGITIDYNGDNNGSYTISSDILGVGNTLSRVDISGGDSAYELAANIGAKFPGGTFLFGYTPHTDGSITAEIIYNVDLFPDDSTLNVEVSFSTSFHIVAKSNYTFNTKSLDVNIDIMAFMAFVIFIIAMYYGFTIATAGLIDSIFIAMPNNNFIIPDTI